MGNTQRSARTQSGALAMDATAAIQLGISSRTQVLCQVVTTLILVQMTLACHTAWPLAPTMCPQQPSTRHVHQVSTRHQSATRAALSLVTQRASMMTNSMQQRLSACVERT